jgi:hypothetical protein
MFKELFNEAVETEQKPNQKESSFDQKPFVPLAMKWLDQKFPQKAFGYTFKHNPKLEVPDMKSYNVSVDGKEFIIVGKAFDTNSDGTKDTVLFKITAVEHEEEQEDAF